MSVISATEVGGTTLRQVSFAEILLLLLNAGVLRLGEFESVDSSLLKLVKGIEDFFLYRSGLRTPRFSLLNSESEAEISC